MSKRRAAFLTLGCKVNQYETDAMEEILEKNGYDIVSFKETADVYIINTCSVTNMADRKSRQMIHRAKKNNPDAVIVAAGCYVQAAEKEMAEKNMADILVGNNKKKDIAQILEEYFAVKEEEQKVPLVSEVIDINHTKEYEDLTIHKVNEHTRAYIKIQDGCNQFCSYCIIPYARGRVRSRKKEDILSEINGLVQRRYQEVVLTGIHLSSYGVDFLEKTDGDYLATKPVGANKKTLAFERGYLIDLIESIQTIGGLKRIRLGSLEPRIITEDFANRLAACSKICPHFHLSLQSGADATLKRINRYYTAAEFMEKVKVLREVFPMAAITTDVIVGFPGETEEEFEETRNYLENIKFYDMHIFKYSKRKNTPASTMKQQIPDVKKQERSDILLAMAEEFSEDYRRSFLGQKVEVLMEEEKTIDGVSYQIGHTPEYVKVAYQSESSLINQLVQGNIKGFLETDLLLLEI